MVREESESNCQCTTATRITRRNNHWYPVEESGEPGDPDVGCSGKSCRSCTAGAIADCVAVCCCPCAVINFFTLTFLKLPWMMGRKCLGLTNKKKKKLTKNSPSRKVEGLECKSETLKPFEEQNDDVKGDNINNSARFEAEVWLELYKVDQLGFGRVSFTGIE